MLLRLEERVKVPEAALDVVVGRHLGEAGGAGGRTSGWQADGRQGGRRTDVGV